MKYLLRLSPSHALLVSMFGALIILSGIILIPYTAQAHSASATTEQAASSQSVTILVLDMSGSMGTNDPQGLRCSAADAYINLSGPGNFIGIIGLDGGNGQGGAHNFDQAKIWTTTPIETATLAQRQQLQQAIATNSHNCQPDSSTPTYDALNKALQMLNTATGNGHIPGSVVLLTDGTPDPDTNAQIAAIQSELLPQFKEHDWPIDTVALGQDGPIKGASGTFHSFLSGLSNATAGKFYDDGKGDVQGISPLNIGPFFLDIFARHNNRIVNKDIPSTPLNGGTTRRNFFVTDYTNSLDVVVVKDQQATIASLRTPDGQEVTQTGSGVFVSPQHPGQDYYEIFSIDHPQAGQWELDVTGSGQFLMNSLKVSGIGLSTINVSQGNLTVGAKSALALGQPLTVSAHLTFNGTPVTDQRFTLHGTITYIGAADGSSLQFPLDDKNTLGTYTGMVTIPDTGTPGSYQIAVQASTVSLDAIIAGQNTTVRIEAFPVPLFISPQTHAVTESTVTSEVTQWDPALRILYSLPLLDHLGAWPLDSLPAQPYANVAGQIVLHQQPYSGATVNAVAMQAGTKNSLPVVIVNNGAGHFHVQFPSSANVTYQVTFHTSGSFEDSHGDFGTTQRTVQLTVVPATSWQEFMAWLRTLAYVAILLLFFLIIRYFMLPHPFGEWICSHEGDVVGRFNYRKARRNPLRGFLKPDLLYSREANMPKGLLLRFRRGSIELRRQGNEAGAWQSADGSALADSFSEIHELRFRPREDVGVDDAPEAVTYLLQIHVDRQMNDDEDEYPRRRGRAPRSQKRRSGSSLYDEDEDLRGSPGRNRRRSTGDDDDW